MSRKYFPCLTFKKRKKKKENRVNLSNWSNLKAISHRYPLPFNKSKPRSPHVLWLIGLSISFHEPECWGWVDGHVSVLTRIPERAKRIPADAHPQNYQKARSISVKCFMHKEGEKARGGPECPERRRGKQRVLSQLLRVFTSLDKFKMLFLGGAKYYWTRHVTWVCVSVKKPWLHFSHWSVFLAGR